MYIDINKKFWNRQYYSPNVESFIFRSYPFLFKDKLNKKNNKIFDFGCGEGSALKHFVNNYNMEPYGVDISKTSIRECKKKLKFYKKNFSVVESKPKKNRKFFNTKFDIIIAVQSLYYLSNNHLNILLNNLNKNLNKNGIVFFTMISTKHEYWHYYSNKKVNSDGLTEVDLRSDKSYLERYDQLSYTHFINFVKSEKDLKKKFNMFNILNIGEYTISLRDWKRSGHHYTIFAQKK